MTEQKATNSSGCGTIIIVLLLLLAALVVFNSVSNRRTYGGRTNPSSSSGSSSVVTLVCEDCAAAGIKINLWSDPDRGSVVGSVPHGTSATIIDDARSSDGRLVYKVRAASITGWITSNFVKR